MDVEKAKLRNRVIGDKENLGKGHWGKRKLGKGEIGKLGKKEIGKKGNVEKGN